MPSAILAKTFAGELTEQDPTSKPVIVMLERIRAGWPGEVLEPKLAKSRAG